MYLVIVIGHSQTTEGVFSGNVPKLANVCLNLSHFCREVEVTCHSLTFLYASDIFELLHSWKLSTEHLFFYIHYMIAIALFIVFCQMWTNIQSKGSFFIEDDGSIVSHHYTLVVPKESQIWLTIQPIPSRSGTALSLLSYIYYSSK